MFTLTRRAARAATFAFALSACGVNVRPAVDGASPTDDGSATQPDGAPVSDACGWQPAPEFPAQPFCTPALDERCRAWAQQMAMAPGAIAYCVRFQSGTRCSMGNICNEERSDAGWYGGCFCGTPRGEYRYCADGQVCLTAANGVRSCVAACSQ